MIAEHAIDWTKPMQEEARREGRQEGEADVLLRPLRRRHGSLSREVEQRVRNADAEQLLEWADRFVAASTLAEVYDATPAD